MRFHTRKWVKPEDLNPNGTLFGGKLLAWLDEELALYAIIQYSIRKFQNCDQTYVRNKF
jgi:acyl-CoA thioesterase YciA